MRHPKWQASQTPNYDAMMSASCTALVKQIESDRAFRLALLRDPRDCHAALFGPFTPKGYPEYAGTCRGTPKTSLEHREAHVPCLFKPDQFYAFTPPGEVAARLTTLMATVNGEMSVARAALPYGKLQLLTYLFSWFGTIHPFLDGNGHIQRALFAAAAAELDIPMSSRFAIHPRSFDRLLASQLEIFTRNNGPQSQLDAIAEYLAFWLAGPFDVPGSGIPPD